MARRATAISQYRNSAPGGVLVLDSGDTFYDDPSHPDADDLDAGGLQVEAMNAMGYDALALGAMDLAPAPVLQARVSQAGFPFLSANLQASEVLTRLQPYVLLDVEGVAVAVIGVSNEARVWERGQELGVPLEVGDALMAVRRSVDEVRERARVIIVLGNLSQKTNEVLAREVAGIDAVVGIYKSWSTQPKAIQGAEGPVVLQGSGTLGEYLGLLTMYFDHEGRVVSFTGRGVALGPDFGSDAEIVRLVEARSGIGQ